MSVREAFAAVAEIYDDDRRKLIPCFDRFYGKAVKTIIDSDPPLGSCLDLGAGTGLLSAMVAKSLPEAQFRLVDLSEEMLSQARLQFAQLGLSAPDTVAANYGELDLGGPYDVVMSALSIHHLGHDAKRQLFAHIHSVLRRGGIFVNAEQVLGANYKEELQLATEWEQSVRAAGLSETALARAKSRMEFDQCAPIEEQLTWMREAGFEDARCVFQDGRFAVLTGTA